LITYSDKLVVFHLDNVTNDHLVPQLIDKLTVSQHPRQPVVYVVVATVTLLRRHTNITMTTTLTVRRMTINRSENQTTEFEEAIQSKFANAFSIIHLLQK